MQTEKFLISLALILCCFVTFSASLQCFTCDTEKGCKSPKRMECNPGLANATRSYLDVHYTGVPMNSTSRYYSCLRDTLTTKTGVYMHKGCIYSHLNSCGYTVRPYYQADFKRSCWQCDNKDGCNPADHARSSLLTVLATIIIAVTGKFLWSS